LGRTMAGGGKIRLLPLIAATYFMVSGGPYGLEDILGMAGYGWALVLLVVVPVVWSLPTSLMVGELAAAIPLEGGYYCWVRRALGSFWGFQEAWLSLAASVFDMAIYPVIFVLYLGRIEPAWTAGYRGTLWALAVVVLCMVWNLWGARAVGEGSVTLWNYMGWDNASTVAQEVEQPQKNYPRAMLASVGLVAVTYVLPLAAMAMAGIPAERFSTGAWTDAARELVGPWLALCVVLGGTINGFGMFNALVMSYTRVPYALAEEGMLPKVVAKTNARGVPWVSVVLCSVGWALALRLSFERLISIDLVLYGGALVLEFVALVVLRVKEPGLARPFKVPGGVWGVVGMGVGPVALIAFALWAARGERVAGLPSLGFAAIVAAAGPVVYFAARGMRKGRLAATPSGMR